MAKPETPRGPGNPRVRAGFYGMAALYLAYLYYQLAEPFFKGDPTGPPLLAFGLGTVVLGGGAVGLGLLAWKIYRAPAEKDGEEDGGDSNKV